MFPVFPCRRCGAIRGAAPGIRGYHGNVSPTAGGSEAGLPPPRPTQSFVTDSFLSPPSIEDTVSGSLSWLV